MAEAEQTPVFQIQRVYLKEASLEQPNSPAIFLEEGQPNIDVQLGMGAENLAEGIFEVSVTATVTTKVNEKVMFLAECKQAAIFEIRHIEGEQLNAVIGVACPQIVYPYLRSNVSDMVTRAGFPPVHLSEMNFQAMYDQQRAEQVEAPAQ
ncbi:MAG: protein-export chaperone SecB [Burkholderiaceae bacterium]|nr:protein-export chaperone SecB [Burkholderiaceae bacterium]